MAAKEGIEQWAYNFVMNNSDKRIAAAAKGQEKYLAQVLREAQDARAAISKFGQYMRLRNSIAADKKKNVQAVEQALWGLQSFGPRSGDEAEFRECLARLERDVFDDGRLIAIERNNVVQVLRYFGGLVAKLKGSVANVGGPLGKLAKSLLVSVENGEACMVMLNEQLRAREENLALQKDFLQRAKGLKFVKDDTSSRLHQEAILLGKKAAEEDRAYTDIVRAVQSINPPDQESWASAAAAPLIGVGGLAGATALMSLVPFAVAITVLGAAAIGVWGFFGLTFTKTFQGLGT